MTMKQYRLEARYADANPMPPGERFSGYFEAAARSELALPRCDQCLRFHWYPLPRCPHCASDSWRWHAVSPYADLFSWTVIRRSLHPTLTNRVGDVVALVVPIDAPDVRIVTNLVGNEPLPIGTRLVAHFIDVEGVILTLFSAIDGTHEGGYGSLATEVRPDQHQSGHNQSDKRRGSSS